MHKVLSLVALLLVTALSGCATTDKEDPAPPASLPQPGQVTDVKQRLNLAFNTSLPFSQVLSQGVFGILPPISVFVDVPLPVTEGGSAANPADEVLAHLGLFLPDIPGCDFKSASAQIASGQLMVTGNGTACKVPVIADAGPYWGESDVEADARGSVRLGEFMIQNFVPHGYAVAQISVLGSGKSTHCFDMFGMAEQLGVHHAVEWLGSQSWSNGAVGLIGRSYDGSTPWMAAAHGSQYLKTIVPISGLIGLQDLVTWNGASEARILTFHNVIYGQFGVEPGANQQFAMQVARRTTCPDWMTATPWGVVGYLGATDGVDVEGTYWQERSFLSRVQDNYKGSVYLIHGLLDNNVDPHAGWPAHVALQGSNDVKGLYGQWFHSYPDRPAEHGGSAPYNSVRYDWAQDLLEWFDHYLMGTGDKPSLHVEVQQTDGRWRIDDAIQPGNATVADLALGTGTIDVAPSAPGPAGAVAPGAHTLSLGILDADNDTVLAGLSTITLRVTPTGPGGQVYVELRDLTADRSFGLSYGIYELRHGTGATGVVPNQAMTIEVPLQYFAGVLPAGNELGLRVANTGNNYLPSPVSAPVRVDLAQSTLHLSTLDVAPEAYFEPPRWDGVDGPEE